LFSLGVEKEGADAGRSRDQTLRREHKENPCSADHKQYAQPHAVDAQPVGPDDTPRRQTHMA